MQLHIGKRSAADCMAHNFHKDRKGSADNLYTGATAVPSDLAAEARGADNILAAGMDKFHAVRKEAEAVEGEAVAVRFGKNLTDDPYLSNQ
jgi:hypothetical protein